MWVVKLPIRKLTRCREAGIMDYESLGVSDTLGRWKENFITQIDMYVTSPASQLASGMLFGRHPYRKI